MSARFAPRWFGVSGLVLLVSLDVVGHASGSVGLGRAPDSVFFIEKSSNRNQVHYAVRVNERCAPTGSDPVHGYWRNYEESPTARSPLLAIEQPAYGLAPNQVSQQHERGGSVRLALRALPSRVIIVETFRAGGGCRALAATRVHGAVGHLRSVYLELGGLLSVRQVVVRAQRLSDGSPLEERLRP